MTGGKDIRSSKWSVTESPDPQDLIWINIQNPTGIARKVTSIIMLVVTTILIVLLVIVSVAISQFRSMYSLLKVIF